MRQVKRLQTPQNQRLYIPVFVDETPDGTIGVTLTEALRQSIFEWDAERYCVSFDADCWAFDGTVRAVRIEDKEGREQAILETHVRLVGQAQELLLGDFRTEIPLKSSASPDARNEWQRALAQKAAREILRAMEARALGPETHS